jgi:hypothetical protein
MTGATARRSGGKSTRSGETPGDVLADAAKSVNGTSRPPTPISELKGGAYGLRDLGAGGLCRGSRIVLLRAQLRVPLPQSGVNEARVGAPGSLRGRR